VRFRWSAASLTVGRNWADVDRYVWCAVMDLIEVGDPATSSPAPHEVVLDGARIAALTDLGLLDTEAEAD